MTEPEEVPDFTSHEPMAISMQVLLLLEKVNNGVDPWSNSVEAYRLIFGRLPDLSRPAEEIYNEIAVALAAMAPEPTPPHVGDPVDLVIVDDIAGTEPPSAEMLGWGPITRAVVNPRGPRSVPTGSPGSPATVRPSDTPSSGGHEALQAVGGNLRWWMVCSAYLIGAGSSTRDWGDFGRQVLQLVVYLLSATVALFVLFELRDRRRKMPPMLPRERRFLIVAAPTCFLIGMGAVWWLT